MINFRDSKQLWFSSYLLMILSSFICSWRWIWSLCTPKTVGATAPVVLQILHTTVSFSLEADDTNFASLGFFSQVDWVSHGHPLSPTRWSGCPKNRTGFHQLPLFNFKLQQIRSAVVGTLLCGYFKTRLPWKFSDGSTLAAGKQFRNVRNYRLWRSAMLSSSKWLQPPKVPATSPWSQEWTMDPWEGILHSHRLVAICSVAAGSFEICFWCFEPIPNISRPFNLSQKWLIQNQKW